MKEKIYQNCLKSAMPHGRGTLPIGKRDDDFETIEKAMTREGCRFKLIEARCNQELTNFLGLKTLWTNFLGQVECDGVGKFNSFAPA